jgi:hypothetical protein
MQRRDGLKRSTTLSGGALLDRRVGRAVASLLSAIFFFRGVTIRYYFCLILGVNEAIEGRRRVAASNAVVVTTD